MDRIYHPDRQAGYILVGVNTSQQSTVIYARVPQSIKDGVDKYAAQQGLTLARAVADLLELGLGGTPRQPVHARLAELEARVAALETRV